MINGPESFWRLVLMIYLWSTLMGRCPFFTQADREAALWLPVLIMWLLPKLDIFVVLSKPSQGKMMPKTRLEIWKICYKILTPPPALCITVSSSQTHPDVFSLSLALSTACWKLPLQYYDTNSICIPTLQFKRTMWHLPACKERKSYLLIMN